jgi:hypothetical protein
MSILWALLGIPGILLRLLRDERMLRSLRGSLDVVLVYCYLWCGVSFFYLAFDSSIEIPCSRICLLAC